MVYDELWAGGPKLVSGENVFAVGTDAVLLSAFADTAGVKRACDLGCGSGIISILLAWNNPKINIDGIELQLESARIASGNVKLNDLNDRINIIHADLRNYREIGNAGAYDLVVANPPYFPVGSGKSVERENIATARDERTCTLKDICKAAAFFTRWGGKFAMVHRPERLSEVFCAMTECGIEPKRFRFVQEKASSLPNLILVEGRRGGKPGLTIERPLCIRNEDGTETDYIKSIYHR